MNEAIIDSFLLYKMAILFGVVIFILYIVLFRFLKSTQYYYIFIVLITLFILPAFTFFEKSKPYPLNNFGYNIIRLSLYPDYDIPKEAVILWGQSNNNEYILLLLQWEGLSTPRYFIMDWNKKLAKELKDSQKEKDGSKSNKDRDIIISNPFNGTKYGDQKTQIKLNPGTIYNKN